MRRWWFRADCSLAALLYLAGCDVALAANKCVVNGKTVYTDAECPQGSLQKPMAEHLAPKPPAQGGAALPKLPELQRGQWKMSGTGEWTTCGNPLQSLYTEYEQFGKLREMGCSVDVISPKDRAVAVSVQCPKESRIGAVDSSFTFSSPNPQSFSVESVLRGKRKTLNGMRIGEC
ncbi:MAG: hypothetical protein ACREVG_16180 [Burkholderiales bacterium]